MTLNIINRNIEEKK